MPIEIRELHIRTIVNDSQSQEQGSTTTSGLSEEERKRLVQECIDRVMQILKDKKER